MNQDIDDLIYPNAFWECPGCGSFKALLAYRYRIVKGFRISKSALTTMGVCECCFQDVLEYRKPLLIHSQNAFALRQIRKLD